MVNAVLTETIRNTPVKTNVVAQDAQLGPHRIYRDVELGEKVGKLSIELKKLLSD